jgi:hypothetical protein
VTVTPDGSKAYVANLFASAVSIIPQSDGLIAVCLDFRSTAAAGSSGSSTKIG